MLSGYTVMVTLESGIEIEMKARIDVGGFSGRETR